MEFTYISTPVRAIVRERGLNLRTLGAIRFELRGRRLHRLMGRFRADHK